MNIYKKIPKDVQYIIIDKLRTKYIKEFLLPDIIKTRHRFIKNQIHKISSIRIYTKYNNSLYDWFNLPDNNLDSFCLKNKYIHFLNKLFPGIQDIKKLHDVYLYYKKTYIGYYEDFINLLLDNLSVKDIEDFYNYVRFAYYIDGNVNKSLLT